MHTCGGTHTKDLPRGAYGEIIHALTHIDSSHLFRTLVSK